jgi:hypothetical protein
VSRAHAIGRNRPLLFDEHGAIALLAVFMAVFMTALVYYVAGIGETVLQRERMQDAADAAAFSAALLHARGMNTLVLINMVMAALLAVLVALKLVELLCAIAIIAISIAAFFAPGLAGAIPTLAQAREQVKEVHRAVRPSIYGALDALHTAARAVRVLVPAASQLRVIDAVRAYYDPPAKAAFAVPPSPTLPTVDGRFETLCEHAGDYTGELTGWAFGAFGMPELVGDLVKGAVADLTKSRADWFCGSSGEPPHTTVEHKYQFPTLSARARCEALANVPDADPAELERACSGAERDEQDSEPDDRGMCTVRCEPDGPYAERARLARAACGPEQPHGDELRHFVWQERRYTRTYAWQHDGWQRASSDDEEEQGARYVRRDEDVRPCGERRSAVDSAWHRDSVDPESGAAQPLCSNARAPRALGRNGAVRRVEHVDVVNIFSCRRTVEQRYDLSAADGSDHVGGDDAQGKVPQAFAAGIMLGDEPLQLRAAVIGELPPAGPEGVVRIAAWGADARRSAAAVAPQLNGDPRELGRVALAQAELYYAVEDAGAPLGDPMWSMRWQARLRRFRLPGQEQSKAAAPTSAATNTKDEPQPVGSEPIYRSLTEGCDAALTRLGGKDGAPCSALERVLRTPSLH